MRSAPLHLLAPLLVLGPPAPSQSGGEGGVESKRSGGEPAVVAALGAESGATTERIGGGPAVARRSRAEPELFFKRFSSRYEPQEPARLSLFPAQTPTLCIDDTSLIILKFLRGLDEN